jgi:hypothetical protein
MDPAARGRFCRKCQREVLDGTAIPAADLETLVAGQAAPSCVRFYPRGRGADPGRCPSLRPRVLAWAALAAAALPGCTELPNATRPIAQADVSPFAGCPSDRSWDRWAPPDAPDLQSGPICTVAPEAPQCNPLRAVSAAHDASDIRLPAHLRLDCKDARPWEIGVIQGQAVTIEYDDGEDHSESWHSWPDGLDVVVAQVASEGVDWDVARRAAVGMLEPLGRCYQDALARNRSTRPQGRLVVNASVGQDGAVAEVDADVDGLPRGLTDCAMRLLRGLRFGRLESEQATFAIDLRFVYRVPINPYQGAPPSRRPDD